VICVVEPGEVSVGIVLPDLSLYLLDRRWHRASPRLSVVMEG
jgi:hypothetical protein